MHTYLEKIKIKIKNICSSSLKHLTYSKRLMADARESAYIISPFLSETYNVTAIEDGRKGEKYSSVLPHGISLLWNQTGRENRQRDTSRATSRCVVASGDRP